VIERKTSHALCAPILTFAPLGHRIVAAGRLLLSTKTQSMRHIRNAVAKFAIML
jgi:hypothetical protein